MYRRGKEKPVVILIGSYPPPYGGVSVHIQRLKDELERRDLECIVYEVSKGNRENDENVVFFKSWFSLFWKLLLTKKKTIVHLHGNTSKVQILISLLSLFGKKTILTIHNIRFKDTFEKSKKHTKFMLKKSLKIYSNIIVVNPMTKEYLVSMKFDHDFIKVIPAYLPPIIKEDEIREIPREVWEFIDCHNPIVSANASNLNFYNGQDLYGLDMCIDLTANLKNYYPKIGLVFALPQFRNREYFEKMKYRIINKGIENNFLFQLKPCQFYPILMKSEVFVRPTNTDGDAISIREALHFSIPTVASDVVSRPPGVIVFNNRSIEDFTSKVLSAIKNPTRYKNNQAYNLESNANKIIDIYGLSGS